MWELIGIFLAVYLALCMLTVAADMLLRGGPFWSQLGSCLWRSPAGYVLHEAKQAGRNRPERRQRRPRRVEEA